MSLLSLPRIHRRAFAQRRTVSPALRARAASEIRLALKAGKLTESEVADACRDGDAGIARLMLRNHALTGEITGTLDAASSAASITTHAASHIIGWARSLVAAGRLSDAQFAELPPKCDLRQLLPLLIASSVDPASSLSARRIDDNCAPVLDVSHSYLDALLAHHEPQGQQPPSITITQIANPFFDLPQSLVGDDLTAVLSALAAIVSADPIGLIASPQHVVYGVNSWVAELLEDGLNTSKRQPDGTWQLDPQLQEMLMEEIGIDTSDADAAQDIGLHMDFLLELRQISKTTWSPNSAAMRRWRSRNTNTPVGMAVAHLFAIHRDLKTINLDRSMIDIQCEGDPVGVMVSPPSIHNLTYFDTNSYAMNETPEMILRLNDSRPNPSSFWQLHQSAVMVANLITEAGHVIQSIHAQGTQGEASEPRLAA